MHSNSSNIDLVVFDLDGTLVDSIADITTAMHHGMSAVGGPAATDERIAELIGRPLVDMFKELLPVSSGRSVEEAARAYREFYIGHCADCSSVYPGIISCLDRLAGIPLAIATTKMTFMAVEVVEKLGIADRFALVQGSDGIPYKPDPAIVNMVLGKLKRNPSRSWMIGDTVYDIQAGKAAGMRTCAVTWGIGGEDGLSAQKPDIVVDKPDDLPGLIWAIS